MKLKLLNRAIRKLNKKQPRASRFVNYDKAHDLLLLFDSDGRDETIQTIVRRLRQDGKNVTAWGYCDTKPPTGTSAREENGVHLFYKRDTGLFHRPRKKTMQAVCTRHYDLLINLADNRSVPLLYLTLYAEAALKAGRHTDLRLFDFMIDLDAPDDGKHPTDGSYLFDQIIFYLKRIQTSD